LKKERGSGYSKKITKLVTAIEKDPFTGIGKPEALKYDLSGFWSRRINEEHRIVYKVYEERGAKIALFKRPITNLFYLIKVYVFKSFT